MRKSLLISFFLLSYQFLHTQELYFPPLNPSLGWDTVSPASLGWCTDKIKPLYDFLEEENTKAFIVLKDGKIVVEKYFGTFVQDSLWYWASAGKTITAFLVGVAREQGSLVITDETSQYLGQGWTACTPQKEDQITIRNQLTMTSGLDDGVPDNHCTIDTCLVCIAPAGSRWAYHNAPYTLLEKVIANATGQNINVFTTRNLLMPTGMTGLWITSGYDNVFISTARSMARFGLLVQNRCAWDQSPVLTDTSYISQMTNTSQDLNKGYGYLWWLNGKESYMVPGSQIVIPGSYAPDAPADMFSGLGKNGQIVSIAKSKGIVFVRMGNQPTSSSSEITTIFCNQIWQHLNEIMCGANSLNDKPRASAHLKIQPNPVQSDAKISIKGLTIAGHKTLSVKDLFGKTLYSATFTGTTIDIDLGDLPAGFYLCNLTGDTFSVSAKIIRD